MSLAAKITAYLERSANPNAFYYRFLPEGEVPKHGPWTEVCPVHQLATPVGSSMGNEFFFQKVGQARPCILKRTRGALVETVCLCCVSQFGKLAMLGSTLL